MIRRRTLLATLAATTVARADEPVTIRFGFANVGVDNRRSPAAVSWPPRMRSTILITN